MVKSKGTGLKNVVFKNYKLVGIHFGDCNPFSLSLHFEDCLLNLSSFYKLKLKGIQFKRCNLQEVDFTETDLTASVFGNCDLAGALFENSILEKVDFETAFNYSIDPNINQIKKAKFSMAGSIGLLFKHDIEIK
jgi:fluoroquinolone resistance protein